MRMRSSPRGQGILPLLVAAACLLPAVGTRAETPIIWTLGADSSITLEEAGVFGIPTGATLTLLVDETADAGSVAIRVDPAGLSIPSLRLPRGQGQLHFSIPRAAEGVIRTTRDQSLALDLLLHVRVTHEHREETGVRDYAIHLTTEKLASPATELRGARVDPNDFTFALVGLTRTGPDSVVGTDQEARLLLSGRLDRLPNF